jgi:hypothetical protein
MECHHPTWGQIKEWVEAQGVKDEDQIYIMEIYEAMDTFPKHFTAVKTPYGWEIL